VAARRLASVLTDVRSVGRHFDRASEFWLRVIDVLLRAQLTGTPRHFDDSAKAGEPNVMRVEPTNFGNVRRDKPAKLRT
jgi:hypothetical protein